MSATNRNPLRTRVPRDEYRTPHWAYEALLDKLTFDPPPISPPRVLEPCAGDGRIASACRDKGASVTEYDLVHHGTNYLDQPPPARGERFRLGITNPPYGLDLKSILTKMLEECLTVATLLRLNYLGGQSRKDWWRVREPTHLYVLSRRPVFIHICRRRRGCGASYHPETAPKICHCGSRVGPGTDATEYAWFVWDHAGVSTMLDQPPGIYHL